MKILHWIEDGQLKNLYQNRKKEQIFMTLLLNEYFNVVS